ncbi:MAG: V-type ATP synthase subunit I [Thermoplasmata archaeon]
MLYPERMDRVLFAGSKTRQKELIDFLYGEGLLHIREIKTGKNDISASGNAEEQEVKANYKNPENGMNRSGLIKTSDKEDNQRSLTQEDVCDYKALGWFDRGSPLEGSGDIARILVRVRSIIRMLDLDEEASKVNSGLFQSFLDMVAKEGGLREIEEEMIAREEEISNISTRISDINSRLRALAEEKRVLDSFAMLGLDFSEYSGYISIGCLTGTVRVSPEKSLKSEIPASEIFYAKVSPDSFIAVFFPKKEEVKVKSILSKCGFTEIPPPRRSGTPSDTHMGVINEINRLEAELKELEKKLQELKEKNREFLLAVEKVLTFQLEKLQIPLHFLTGKETFVVEGYLPSKKEKDFFSKFKERFGEYIYYEKEPADDHDEEVPVELKNPGPVRGFQIIQELHSLPQYGEIDPTLFLFITFPLFFGFMIGDLGYGLLFIVLGAILKKKVGPAGDVLILCGIISSLFGGLLFMDAFGLPITHTPEGETSWFRILGVPASSEFPPLINKFSNMKSMISLSFILAVFHLDMAFILGFLNEKKHLGPVKAFGAKISWILLQLGLFIVIMLVLGARFNFLSTKNTVILAISIILTAILFLGFSEGIAGIVELPSVLSNVLSYLRLAAISVSKAGMALALNVILIPMYESGILWKVIVGVIITLVFHPLILVLGLVSAGLHSLRLEFVEFFSKFFAGGGKPYRPFGGRFASLKGNTQKI